MYENFDSETTKDKFKEKTNNLIENIKASPNWECKRLRQHKRGAENYFPKQVGFSRDGLTAITDEEFIELVANHIEFYLQVMKDWE